MSILIKGMAMPGNCGECAFCRAAIWKGKEYPCVCLARNIIVKPSETDMRDGLCPLLPVPDHGDLVDRDIVWRDMVHTESFQEAQIAIWKAPVVIPAERSEG